MGVLKSTSEFVASPVPPAMTINPEGTSPFVLVCDHASNRIPEPYRGLGLSGIERLRHIAWDPGALAVSLRLAERLDAPLVHSTVSRLVIDCNRAHAAPDLIPAISETTAIPGNQGLSAEERARRRALFHDPFHAAIEALLNRRAAAGRETILVAMHSFTPVYKGVARPWPIGFIHGIEADYTRGVFEALKAAEPALNIGWNLPYAALNGVTYTLEHHGDGRGLKSTMIEIRHDEILTTEGIRRWVRLLADCLEAGRHAPRRA
jgi:predicted N-formylglutamate amidohydrolase